MIEYSINGGTISECEYISTALNQIQTSEELQQAYIRQGATIYEISREGSSFLLSVTHSGKAIVETKLQQVTDFFIQQQDNETELQEMGAEGATYCL